MAPGLIGGVVIGRAIIKRSPANVEDTRALASEGGAYAGASAEETATSSKRAGSSLDAKAIHGSLFENLQIVARGMSPAQRLDELTRMMAEDTKPGRNYTRRSLQPGGVNRQLQYMALVQPEDLPQLKKLLENIPPNQTGGAYQMRTGCATAWAMLDPQGMEGWVKERLEKDRDGSISYEAGTLAKYWTSLDFDAAWAKAAELDRTQSAASDDNSYWIQTMMGKFISENAQVSYQKAQSLQNRGVRQAALSAILTDMAKNDLGKAMEMAGQQESTMDSNKLEATVLSNFTSATSKYQEAGDYILQHGSQYSRDRGLTSLVLSWALKDREGLQAWMKTNESEVASLDLEQRWGDYLDRNQDPETLITRAMELKDADKRRQKLGSAYSILMNRQPDEALSRLRSLDPETQEQVAPSILRTLSQYDPERAIAVLPSLPEAAQVEAVKAVFSRWMTQNPEDASTWLDKQPTGPVKDRGIEQLVSSQTQHDPETAAIWALQISKEDRQRNSLKSVMYQWGEVDPKAARAWVEQQNLPAESRQQILSPLEAKEKSRASRNP